MGTHALEVARIEAGFIQARRRFPPGRPGDHDSTVRARRSSSTSAGWWTSSKPVFNGRRALLEEKKKGSRFRFVKLDIEGNKPARSSYIYDKRQERRRHRDLGRVVAVREDEHRLASLHMPWGRPGDELWAEIYYQRELKWYTRHGALPRGREAHSGIRRAAAHDARRGFLTAAQAGPAWLIGSIPCSGRSRSPSSARASARARSVATPSRTC